MFTGVKLLKTFGPTFYMLFKECFAAFHRRPSKEIKLLKIFGPSPPMLFKALWWMKDLIAGRFSCRSCGTGLRLGEPFRSGLARFLGDALNA
jgi:hypothetical protein